MLIFGQKFSKWPTGMAGSILVVLPSIDPTFSQCFWLRDVYVFDSSHLNSGVVPSISSSLQSRQKKRIGGGSESN